MSLSRPSLRAWSLLSHHAWPSSSIIITTIPCSAAALSYNTPLTRHPRDSSTPPQLVHRRRFADFKRYTMDQTVINDLKSQPRNELLFRNNESKTELPRLRTAYIALGSNLGDRVAMIEQACKEMDLRGIKVRRTSSLWETEPMYVLDQDRFVNGACEVRLLFLAFSFSLFHHTHISLRLLLPMGIITSVMFTCSNIFIGNPLL